jgi:hypothetical protein
MSGAKYSVHLRYVCRRVVERAVDLVELRAGEHRRERSQRREVVTPEPDEMAGERMRRGFQQGARALAQHLVDPLDAIVVVELVARRGAV